MTITILLPVKLKNHSHLLREDSVKYQVKCTFIPNVKVFLNILKRHKGSNSAESKQTFPPIYFCLKKRTVDSKSLFVWKFQSRRKLLQDLIIVKLEGFAIIMGLRIPEEYLKPC